MIPLAKFWPTISQEIEDKISCSSTRKSGSATFSTVSALPAHCAGRAFFIGGDDQRIAAARQFLQSRFISPEHEKERGAPAGLGQLGSSPASDEFQHLSGRLDYGVLIISPGPPLRCMPGVFVPWSPPLDESFLVIKQDGQIGRASCRERVFRAV